MLAKRRESIGDEPVEVDIYEAVSGPAAAQEIAQWEHACDSEAFHNGGTLTILEPAHMAGDYEVTVDYEPVFYAYRKAAQP